ncbi:uncharacterized protein LOC128234342 [Mya arenaria]|uniref:uncharacterized protein LOC128234342 n=1 Tax=Mya arenaria TaxID=6604 RepID=UPI0022E74F50|nr:uncharacterized protein LOC128234342 [Mya arenaria]
MQFQFIGRHNFTCKAKNTIGSAENTVLIVVKEKPPASPSTGKGLSSSMLIGITCGCLAVVIIAMVVFGCVTVLKTRKKTTTREESYNVPIQERQPSFQPLDPDYNDPAGSNHGDGPSRDIAEPVEYTCVVKRAVRQTTKPQAEERALIYADLDLPAEGSTRRKPTVNSDAETTYVSIDFARTKK